MTVESDECVSEEVLGSSKSSTTSIAVDEDAYGKPPTPELLFGSDSGEQASDSGGVDFSRLIPGLSWKFQLIVVPF